MAWISTYRACSLVIATITAIIVLGLCAHSTAASRNALSVTFHYSNMGLAASIMTLVAIPWMLLIDCLRGGTGSIILFELLYLSLLWILFTAAGALTFVDANFSTIVKSCDELTFPDLISICRDSQPIGIFSFVTAIILFAYTLTLLIVASSKSTRNSDVWKLSVKDCEKL